MDTKTVRKQPQVLFRGDGLTGGVYKTFISFISFLNYILLPHHSKKN